MFAIKGLTEKILFLSLTRVKLRASDSLNPCYLKWEPLSGIKITQILVKDGLYERPSLIGPAHYIFLKIL